MIKHQISDEYGDDNHYSLQSIQFEIMIAIEQAISNSLQKGPINSFPLIGVRVTIKDGSYSAKRSNSMSFEICANALSHGALRQGASHVALVTGADRNERNHLQKEGQDRRNKPNRKQV